MQYIFAMHRPCLSCTAAAVSLQIVNRHPSVFFHPFCMQMEAAAHSCRMAIARFLDSMCFALRASGLWLRYAMLQNLIPSFPWIAPVPWIAARTLHHGTIQGKEGIIFCHLATLLLHRLRLRCGGSMQLHSRNIHPIFVGRTR